MLHFVPILNVTAPQAQAALQAAYACTGADQRALANYNRCTLVLVAGTDTGSMDFTFDTLSASYDGGSTYATVQGSLAKQFTAVGGQSVAITGPFGAPTHLKFAVTTAQLTASHYPATFTATLHVGHVY